MQARKFKRKRFLRHALSFPFIWAVFFPVVLLDISLEVYHLICFPLYGLEKVSRRRFIRIDRHKLPYLNWREKINCAYCGYVNGVLAYAKEIAGRTEGYWCGIKHEEDELFQSPRHHENFAAYGDEKEFQKKYSD